MLINQITSLNNLHSHDQIDFEINAEVYSFKKESSYDLNIGSYQLVVWESIFDSAQTIFGNGIIVISLNNKFFAKIKVKDNVYIIDSTLVKNDEIPPVKILEATKQELECIEPDIMNMLPLEEIQKQLSEVKKERTDLTITLSFALTQGFYDAYENNIDSIVMDIAMLLQYARRTFYHSSDGLYQVNFITHLLEDYATYADQQYCYSYFDINNVFNSMADGKAPNLVDFKYNTQADILIIGEQLCSGSTANTGGRANSQGIPDYDHSNIVLAVQPNKVFRTNSAKILAHEIGHLMGGVHPLADGQDYDPQYFPGYGIRYRNPKSPDPNVRIIELGTIMSGTTTYFFNDPAHPENWLISWSMPYQFTNSYVNFPEELGGLPAGIEIKAHMCQLLILNLPKIANMWENKDNK